MATGSISLWRVPRADIVAHGFFVRLRGRDLTVPSGRQIRDISGQNDGFGEGGTKARGFWFRNHATKFREVSSRDLPFVDFDRMKIDGPRKQAMEGVSRGTRWSRSKSFY